MECAEMRAADQNEYELCLDKAAIYRGNLILINRDHPIRCTKTDLAQVPRTLMPAAETVRAVMYADRECLRQLQALLISCQAKREIAVTSAYRSNTEQQYLYETSLAERGQQFTESYVARPGESEHQIGLAIDVGENVERYDEICPSFPDTGICGMFKQKAARYGYIQRYKEGKEYLTKIACEPWHFRYVGFPHSVIMEKNKFCLEEYIDYLREFRADQKHLFFEQKAMIYEIYYVPANSGLTIVPISNPDHYDISGNNIDGFIVTTAHSKRQ